MPSSMKLPKRDPETGHFLPSKKKAAPKRKTAAKKATARKAAPKRKTTAKKVTPFWSW